MAAMEVWVMVVQTVARLIALVLQTMETVETE